MKVFGRPGPPQQDTYCVSWSAQGCACITAVQGGRRSSQTETCCLLCYVAEGVGWCVLSVARVAGADVQRTSVANTGNYSQEDDVSKHP